MNDKNKTSNIIKDTNIPKAREGGGKSRRKRIWTKKSSQESVMVVTTPPSRGVRSRKRKYEAEEASPSADAVSVKKGGSAARRLTDVLVEIEASTTPGKE